MASSSTNIQIQLIPKLSDAQLSRSKNTLNILFMASSELSTSIRTSTVPVYSCVRVLVHLKIFVFYTLTYCDYTST